MPQYATEDRPGWKDWVTPKLLERRPIHRWYVFPHSFRDELVHGLIEEWALTPEDRILDPFVGAGTTLLAAKEKGIPAVGYDISPLAILAARVKIADYQLERLKDLSLCLQRSTTDLTDSTHGDTKEYSALVREALPGRVLAAFHALNRAIVNLPATDEERDFFRLALLSTIREYSRAVPNGGWLRWFDREQPAETVPAAFSKHVSLMMEDIVPSPRSNRASWYANEADARSLPDDRSAYTAVITSPPYPNRHDYTRVFGVELMFGFMDWEQTRQLRFQSFHSHPEARPHRPPAEGYHRPSGVAQAVATLSSTQEDPRVIKMIDGYFLDLYLVLREVQRVCRNGARIAFVVGNAQYQGLEIAVDELTAELGEQAGLKCEKLIVVRYRGNSAQQMKRYGRRPSRESIVVFRKPNSDSLPPDAQ